ncbi:MAG: NTP transferase domain-containing protein [Synechococcus sp. s2_metabat2_7]|nr:NTP transferase domain-containing protein [Synechococcus sp. s2_metabat2_7]
MDLPIVQGLRACVLSGGMSRRMGQDKSLLAHPHGGCWLTHSIGLCRYLDLPVDVVSSIPRHRQLVSTLEGVECRSDSSPGQGPLAALSAVFGQAKVLAFLVLPVDMPCLDASILVRLIHAWQEQPSLAVVSHDGSQLQPLFAIYPNHSVYRDALWSQLAAEQLSMHDWLERVPYRVLALPYGALRNLNCPADLGILAE